MGILRYTLFAYGMTAVLSLLVTGLIVLISMITNKKADEKEPDHD